MKRLLLVLVAAALLAPGAARSVACSPLDCAPSQFTFAHGTLLGVRAGVDGPLRVIDLRTGKTRWTLPAGIVTRGMLVHQDGRLLTWYSAAHGTRQRDAVVQRHGTFVLVGTSQDAARAVLARTQARSTSFAIVSRTTQRLVELGGSNWTFDALDGQHLFLIQRLSNGYQVRLYDLARDKLQAEPLKDPHDGALIDGVPFARASSANGRYLFTLYVGTSGGAMVHELDTAAGYAYCIELPGSGRVAAASTWGLVPDVDSGTLWAVSPGAGRVVAVDAAAHSVRLRYSFVPGRWSSNPVAGVLAPDGEHIAFTDAEHVWIETPAKATVTRQPQHVAIALGWSPDQSGLWLLGERSRVSRLRLRLVH
jgi:hypothetical protein